MYLYFIWYTFELIGILACILSHHENSEISIYRLSSGKQHKNPTPEFVTHAFLFALIEPYLRDTNSIFMFMSFTNSKLKPAGTLYIFRFAVEQNIPFFFHLNIIFCCKEMNQGNQG